MTVAVDWAVKPQHKQNFSATDLSHAIMFLHKWINVLKYVLAFIILIFHYLIVIVKGNNEKISRECHNQRLKPFFGNKGTSSKP